MIYFCRIVAASLILAWLPCQLNVFGDDRAELASYFDAQIANWSAIRTLDVICRTDLMREPGIEPGVTSTTYERFVFDSPNERYTYVRASESRPMSESDDKLAKSVFSGFVLRDGIYKSFEVGRPQGRAKPVVSREQVFDEHRVPDWRIVMLMNRSRGSSRTWTGKNFSAMQYLPQQAVNVRKSALGRDYVEFESFGANDAGNRYRFQDEDLTPSKTTWLVKGDSDKVMEVGVERYRWKLVNKIHVPDTVQGAFRDRQFRLAPTELQKLDVERMSADEIGKLFIDVTTYRDMQFNWLVVNGELDDRLLDFDLLDDPTKFISLCDSSLMTQTER